MIAGQALKAAATKLPALGPLALPLTVLYGLRLYTLLGGVNAGAPPQLSVQELNARQEPRRTDTRLKRGRRRRP